MHSNRDYIVFLYLLSNLGVGMGGHLFRSPSPINYLPLDQSQVRIFRHEQGDSFSNLLLIGESLYLTSTFYVLGLNAVNIACDRSRQDCGFKQRLIKATNMQDYAAAARPQNYIKFLGFRKQMSDLIVCGTNFGRPHIYDLKESDFSNQLEYNGDFLCPGVEHLHNLNLISAPNSEISRKNSLMYAAVWITEGRSDEYGIFSRYGIFRKTIEVNRHLARSLFSPYWLWEPTFRSIFEDDKYVFFFFTEMAIEQFELARPGFDYTQLSELSDLTAEAGLARYSRVARVSKNDLGARLPGNPLLNQMWTTFRKIQLSCQCDQFRFPNSEKVFSVSFDRLFMVKILTVSHRLVAVFHEDLPDFQTNKGEFKFMNKVIITMFRRIELYVKLF